MPGLLLLAAAAAASPLPQAETRFEGEAQAVLDAQRAAPPRTDGHGGLTAEEARLVMQRYLQSIGKPLDRPGTGSPR